MDSNFSFSPSVQPTERQHVYKILGNYGSAHAETCILSSKAKEASGNKKFLLKTLLQSCIIQGNGRQQLFRHFLKYELDIIGLLVFQPCKQRLQVRMEISTNHTNATV